MSESDCEHRIALAPSQPAAAPLDKPSVNDTITFSGDSLTLSGAQLLEALDFIAPDRDADQLESEVTIQYGEGHTGKGMYCWCTEYPEEGAIFIDGSTAVPAAPAPSPADERAAFEWPLLPLLPETVITTADGEAVFTAHQMQGYANAYGEMVRARAASASATGAEGALIERLKLLLSGDAAFCRTIVARAAIEQAIAILSRSPAMAAEAEKPFGWAQPKGGNYFTRNESSAKRIGGLVPVYTAPQPAQADAPAETRLTDEQREAIQRAIDYADMSDRDSDAEALRALLATPLPEPRAEATDAARAGEAS